MILSIQEHNKRNAAQQRPLLPYTNTCTHICESVQCNKGSVCIILLYRSINSCSVCTKYINKPLPTIAEPAEVISHQMQALAARTPHYHHALMVGLLREGLGAALEADFTCVDQLQGAMHTA